MQVTFIVMSVMLAALFLTLGLTKVLRVPRMVERARHLGYSPTAFQGIGALEVAAAAGLVIGIFWAPLGIAAAIGLAALLVGAVLAHLKAGDGIPVLAPPAWVGMVAAATAVIGVVAP